MAYIQKLFSISSVYGRQGGNWEENIWESHMQDN